MLSDSSGAPAQALVPAVDAMVEGILACAPAAVRAQKDLIVRWRQTDLATAVRLGIDAFAASCATGELREGGDAFLARRPPRFGAPH
jgi:enoyl-CoA hydratase/carnithine racemase